MQTNPTRYGIWDRKRDEWAVRDQCESRVDALLESLYDSHRYEKRNYLTWERV